MKKNLKQYLPTVIVLSLLLGCGQNPDLSGDGTPSGNEVPNDSNTATDNDNGIHLSNLPSLMAAEYDYVEPSSLALKNTDISFKPSDPNADWESQRPEGNWARGACEMKQAKSQLFDASGQTEVFLCYIKKIEAADKQMVIPKDQWAYYDINFPTFPGGPSPYLRARIGQFGAELKLNVCNSQTGDRYTHTAEMNFKNSKDGYEGHISRFIDQSGVGNTSEKVRIEFDLKNRNLKNFDDASFSFLLNYSDALGNSYQALTNFTGKKSNGYNELNSASHFTQSGWGDKDISLSARWNSNRTGANKYHLISYNLAPSAEQCLAMGVAEEELASCAGFCKDRDGLLVAADESGYCNLDVLRAESFEEYNAESPISFGVVANESSNYFDTVKTNDLALDYTIVGKYADFDAPWNCESETGFVKFNAKTMTKTLQACGDIYGGTTHKSCEAEAWASK
jgi:hypothetical protein